ncbi:MAG: HNH endonuclease [Acidimicrobiia bacterium]|nr:HNH endonuclease [Acidimicrobiia bacterium]
MESGGVVQAAIRSLAEPANLDPADTRTPAQRRADALAELSRRHLDGETRTGSSRPHLTVTVPWDTLKTGTGLVDTEAGPITAEAARRLACDATISQVVLKDGVPVTSGDARRRIPGALRRALDLRDKHCTHPGCDIPARWCDAHHILHWADGGKTTLANLRLLCRPHHRGAHNHQPYPRRE